MLASIPIELSNSDGKSKCRDTETEWSKFNFHDGGHLRKMQAMR
jgi:hypothetical protein